MKTIQKGESSNEYRVVKILDSESIVINAGSENNVKIGEKFQIVGKGISVEDPETGESLGVLDNIKETVSVVKIFPKMCICSHISEKSSVISIANTVSGFYSSGGKYKKILNVDKNQIFADDNADKTIRIGDKVKKYVSLNNIESTKD